MTLSTIFIKIIHTRQRSGNGILVRFQVQLQRVFNQVVDILKEVDTISRQIIYILDEFDWVFNQVDGNSMNLTVYACLKYVVASPWLPFRSADLLYGLIGDSRAQILQMQNL